MKRINRLFLITTVMFALLACSLFTVDETPAPAQIDPLQTATLPAPTAIPATATQQPTSAPAPTSEPAPTSAPAATLQNACLPWSQVTAAMAGEYKCVRGEVLSTYQAENGTYIRFSDKAASFYFIYLYQGNTFYYYPDLKTGACVQAYGTILAFQGVPRIEISGSLDYCD
jgi:hypothetical protein